MAESIEKLRIHNFAGIRDAEIDLSRMTVLIGPQATGKSICAKLYFYFKQIVQQIPEAVIKGQKKDEIRNDQKDLFLRYFPSSAWGDGTFEIHFTVGEFS